LTPTTASVFPKTLVRHIPEETMITFSFHFSYTTVSQLKAAAAAVVIATIVAVWGIEPKALHMLQQVLYH
jgi:hypothetical protein